MARKKPILFACAVIILCMWLGSPERAHAETGLIGGVVGFNGCVDGCQEDGTSAKQCKSLCTCALTIESTRWREELLRADVRAAACRAKVFRGIDSPDAAPLRPLGARAGDGLSAASNRTILICTPMYTDSKGVFLPEHQKALDDGTMERHWREVDVLFNELKQEHATLRNTKPGYEVRFIVATYQRSLKVDSIEYLPGGNARCPERYRSERYAYDAWMSKPGMRPVGVKSL